MDKIKRATNKRKAADTLVENNYYTEAVAIYWHATRDILFSWLADRNIEYNSTAEAMLRFIQKTEDRSLAEKLIFAETFGTLAEWDENITVNEQQALEFKAVCQLISNAL